MATTALLTARDGWLIFALYGAGILLLTWLFTKKEQSKDEHLVANRNVGVFAGMCSVAVTWIWAPAIFIASQKSFEQGLPGIFWFTVPNIVTFFVFAPLALRLRRLLPGGYSMPDYIWRRFGGARSTHGMFLIVTLGYELGAIIINTLAGGLLMHTIAGIDLQLGILCLAGIALIYSAWRGLPASIITDIVQMGMILFIAAILVPWSVLKAGGISAVAGGIGGVTGNFTDVFDPWIAYSFGIPATLGLISGPISDQMFYQRAMAARMRSIVKTFVFGGLLFGIVPVVLSIFGFLAANPAITPALGIVDNQMVGVYVVEHFLPSWTLFGFALMALAGLSSTLDSAYVAVGSLIGVDVYHRYIRPDASDRSIVRASQIGMILFVIVGTAIAMIPGMKLLWAFLIYGALASSALVPTVLSLYWKRLTAKGAFWAILISFAVGLPLSIYANVTENTHLVVLAAFMSVILGLVVCLFDGYCRGHRLRGE